MGLSKAGRAQRTKSKSLAPARPWPDVTPHVYRSTCRILCGGARTFPTSAARRQAAAFGPARLRCDFIDVSPAICRRLLVALGSPFSTAPFVVRGVLRADDGPFVSAYPERGVGGAPGGAHWSSRRACEARQPRWRNAAHPVATGTAPLGAPPWRFSAAGPRVTCPTVPPDHAATSQRPGRKAKAVRVPQPPGRGCTAVPGRHDPAPPAGSSPETPLLSEDANRIAWLQYVVNSVVAM